LGQRYKRPSVLDYLHRLEIRFASTAAFASGTSRVLLSLARLGAWTRRAQRQSLSRRLASSGVPAFDAGVSIGARKIPVSGWKVRMVREAVSENPSATERRGTSVDGCFFPLERMRRTIPSCA
jgi:hypothetical protein